MRKKNVIGGLFFVEVIALLWIYYTGNQGLKAVSVLQQECRVVERQIDDMQSEIANLEGMITEWNTDTYFREKVAREQLNMARENEEIYLT